MVWGGIANGLKTPLVVINGSLNAVKYRDTVLRPHIVPFVQILFMLLHEKPGVVVLSTSAKHLTA